MKHYVLGFFFDVTDGCVLLILKNKPAWQKGLFNGLGGHVEAGESSIEAMIREFKEGSGLDTTIENWQHIATLDNTSHNKSESEKWVMDVYRGEGDINGFTLECDEGELMVFNLSYLPSNMEQTGHWLLLMCADKSNVGIRGKFGWSPQVYKKKDVFSQMEVIRTAYDSL